MKIKKIAFLVINFILISCSSEKCKIEKINKNGLGFYSGKSDILVKDKVSKINDTIFLSDFEEVIVDYSQITPLKHLECQNALIYNFNFKDDYIYLDLTYKKDFKILDITTSSLTYSKKFNNINELKKPIYIENDTITEKGKIKKLVFINGKFTSLITGDNKKWVPNNAEVYSLPAKKLNKNLNR